MSPAHTFQCILSLPSLSPPPLLISKDNISSSFRQTLTLNLEIQNPQKPETIFPMDPCPFVRVLIGNLALKLPVSSRRPARAGVHPSTSPCFSLIRLNNLKPQTSPVALTTDDAGGDLIPQNLTLAASFVLSRSDLEKASKLRISIFTGRRGSTCGVSAGKLLGKVKMALDLKGGEGKKGVLYENGWVDLGKECRVHLTVRSEPDPRFVMEFDGEVECSPQVFQVNGRMRQPVFSCKFSTGDRHLRMRSLPSEPTASSRSWLSSFGSDRERPTKERKGWYVTIHDLSGSTVAMASMATPFVASPGNSDRVSSSNPGSWIIFRRGGEDTPILKPWGRLEAWHHRGGLHNGLGYRFELMPDANNINAVGISLAESTIDTNKGGKFIIDLTSNATLSKNLSPGCSPRGSGDLRYCLWPLFSGYRGFVMSSTVEGDGKCSKPVVEIGVQHVGCTEDAAAFVALAAAIDLSMDACRPFSQKLRKELLVQQDGSV